MLGLPSTVAVGRVIPKNAFYRNLKMTSALRDAFTHDVEKIEMAASIKEATCGIPAGEHVAEVVVLALDVRERTVPRDVVAAIIRGIPNKVLVACRHEGEVALALVRQQLQVGTWQPEGDVRLALRGATLDDVWDALSEQVIFADGAAAVEPASSSEAAPSLTIDERIERERRIEALRRDVATLTRKHDKEKQIAKRNALFKQLKAAKRELAELEN